MINFETLPQDNPLGLQAEGLYFGKFEDATYQVPQGEGKSPYLNLKIKLRSLKGESAGYLFDILSESDKNVARYKVGRVLIACGIPLKGSMDLKDIGTLLKNREVLVYIVKDEKSERPRMQVDLFKHEGYYPIAQLNELTEVLEEEKPEEANADFTEVATDTPFTAADGAVATTIPDEVEY